MSPPLEKAAKCEVSFIVNGEAKKVLAHPMERLWTCCGTTWD